MTWRSVLIEAGAPAGAEFLATDDERFDALLDAVAEYDGVVTAASDRYGVRISVQADDPLRAIMSARDRVWKSVAKVGLPDWPYIRIDATTHDELDTEPARPPLPDLLGTAEVAAALAMSRQRLAEIRQQKVDFPRPVVELAAGPVWIRSAIEAWAKTWARKPGRPPSNETPRVRKKEHHPAPRDQRPAEATSPGQSPPEPSFHC